MKCFRSRQSRIYGHRDVKEGFAHHHGTSQELLLGLIDAAIAITEYRYQENQMASLETEEPGMFLYELD